MSKLDRISSFHIWLVLATIITIAGLISFVQTCNVMDENHRQVIILQSHITDMREQYYTLEDRIKTLGIKLEIK